MIEFIARRIVAGVVVLFLITTIVFFLFRAVPGDVVERQLAEAGSFSTEELTRVREELGLDRPLVVQYVTWLGGVARGDLGESLLNQRSVASLVWERVPVTFELTVLSLVVAVLFGLTTGVISAIRRGTAVDASLRLGSIFGLSMPNFWLGLLLLTLASLWFGWSPPIVYRSFFDDPVENLQKMALPVIALASGVAASITRLTRSSMLEVLNADFIRTVRAKGATETDVNVRHALRNSLITVVTLIGLQFGALLGGTVALESLFSVPGLGKLVFDSANQRDYPVVQAAVLFYGGVFIVVNLLTDIAYGWIDPRIRAR